MTKDNKKAVNATQPEKDKKPDEDTYEKDNNTNVAATPRSSLTTEESPEPENHGRNTKRA